MGPGVTELDTTEETTAAPPQLTVRAFLRQGFRVSLLYCVAGLALEMLHSRISPSVYGHLAAFFYGLPGLVLQRTGLELALTQGVLQGRLPGWIAAAAFPAVGVLLILAASALAGLVARFIAMVLSLRQD
jgi:hypothetical protein